MEAKRKRQLETIKKIDEEGISLWNTTREGKRNCDMLREKFINTPVINVFFIEYHRRFYSSELASLSATTDTIPTNKALHCFQNIYGDVLVVSIDSWDSIPEEFYHLGRENLTKRNMFGWSSPDMPNSAELDFSKEVREVYNVTSLGSLKEFLSL